MSETIETAGRYENNCGPDVILEILSLTTKDTPNTLVQPTILFQCSASDNSLNEALHFCWMRMHTHRSTSASTTISLYFK